MHEIQNEFNELNKKKSTLEKNLSLADLLNHDANNLMNNLKLQVSHIFGVSNKIKMFFYYSKFIL